MRKREIFGIVSATIMMTLATANICAKEDSKYPQVDYEPSFECYYYAPRFDITVAVEEPTEVVTEPVVEISTEELIEESSSYSYAMSSDWDARESYELCKIAMAEAEGEGLEGKAHVMMVVLNRVADDRFPDTIHDVIFQPNQFSPIGNGRYDRVEPDSECWEALDMIMTNKWDESQGALYFESHKDPDNWHSQNLEYLFTHGGHRFYK